MTTSISIPTERSGLILREFSTREDDIALFDLIQANRSFWPDISDSYPSLQSVRDDREFADYEQDLRLGVVNQEMLIGWMSLIRYSPGDTYGNWLGIWLDRGHTGLGYATAAVRACVSYVDNQPELNKVITTTTQPDNESSIKLLTKAGFILQAGEQIRGYTGELVFKLSLAK